MKPTCVLLCDDDQLDGEVFAEAITKNWNAMFHEPIAVERCTDIVEVAGTTQLTKNISDVGSYDAVLLDIVWPKGEARGISIARDLRAKYPELPIVVFSENVTTSHFSELIPLGLAGYVTKNHEEVRSACAQVHEAIIKAHRDRGGQPLYKKLRAVVSMNPQPWCAECVGNAASAVWREDNPKAKWDAFWGPWLETIGKQSLFFPFDEMKRVFSSNDLLALGTIPAMRGHLEHVLHVYFTGYVLSHSIPSFREWVMGAVKDLIGRDYEHGKEEEYWGLFQFAWLAAATLHDAAYPLEILPDVLVRLQSIASTFPFASFDGGVAVVSAQSVDLAQKGGDRAKKAFESILGVLYRGVAPPEWIIQQAVFAGGSGQRRFNHGVLAGAMYVAAAEKWEGFSGQSAQTPLFNRWAGVAMALHSLKMADEGAGVHIALRKDPLSFLLSLCDELQVWNRNRPDDTAGTGSFKRVELAELELSDDTVRARIDYVPYSGASQAERQRASESLVARITKDQQVLHRYWRSDPLKVLVTSRIAEWSVELPAMQFG